MQFPVRRSVRLKGFDYSQPSTYFLTVCTHDKRWIFGEVIGHEVALSRCGKIVSECWRSIPAHFPNVELAAHVVMPNHVHGVIIVKQRARTDRANEKSDAREPRRIGALPPGSIPAIVRSFKSVTTRRIHEAASRPHDVWQRGYYERIIRDDDEFRQICEYIRLNPANWASDDENSATTSEARSKCRFVGA